MVNDVTIIAGIVLFFIALGVLLPPIRSDFTGQFQNSTLPYELLQSKDIILENETSICVNEKILWIIPSTKCYAKEDYHGNFFNYVKNIAKMFFWSFGIIPFYIDLLLMIPLRIILVILFFRLLYPFNGGG